MTERSEQSQQFTARRRLLGTIASSAVTAFASVATGHSRAVAQSARSKILVAYFTRTGNTRVVALQIRRALQADLFEIEPANPYPEDYEETVAQAVRERDSGYRPPLKGSVPDVSSYEVVFLGFPIWGETAPPVIRSFLSQHELSGKTVVPFITHGGYGQGRSMNVVKEHAPGGRIVDPFIMEADQERRTLMQVSEWLARVNVRK